MGFAAVGTMFCLGRRDTALVGWLGVVDADGAAGVDGLIFHPGRRGVVVVGSFEVAGVAGASGVKGSPGKFLAGLGCGL